MASDPWLINEPARLAALAEYDILDTEPEADFDRIVQLAARVCNAPTALVSLIDKDRQWFKARVGFDGCETPVSHSICAFALEKPELLVIPDLTDDPRTRENPYVADEAGIRFYAGAPLLTSQGVAIGTLCVVDTSPRPEGLSPSQSTTLIDLAAEVAARIEARSPHRGPP